MEDSAIYLNIAQSLVEGRGLINTVGPIDSSGRYYPILLPSVIAFFWHWWGRNLLLFKSVNIVFALLFIGFLFKWAEEFFNDRLLSIAVIMFMAVSWQIAMYAHAILTEIPYLFFQLPRLYALMRYGRREKALNWYPAVIFISFCCAFYMRLVGFSLLIAALAYFFIVRRDFSKGITSAVVMSACTMPWLLQNVIFGRSNYIMEFSFYTSGAVSLARRWFYNLAATIAKELPDLFLHPSLSTIDPHSRIFIFKAATGCIIATGIITGLLLRIRKMASRS